MKYLKFNVLFAALVLIFASSCSNEEDLVPPSNPDRAGSITFRIQGKNQPVSYADAIATTDENAVDSLEIYMFNDRSAESQPNVLQKVFRVGSADLKQEATNLTATVDVEDRTGKHTFYFVANVENNASALATITPGVSTEDDFIEQLTDVQSELLATPLLMTAHKVIENVETPTDTDKQVKLLRRVARFDILNDASVTNFTVDKILINDAKKQGYIFGNATGTLGQTLATDKLPKIENNKPNDFNTGIQVVSAFYLYPTKLETGETIISFEGEFKGERVIYSLDGATTIEANKRYTLKVGKSADDTPELSIEVGDWDDDGGTHEAKPQTKDVTISKIEMAGGNGVIVTDMDYDITDINEETTLTFTVESYHASSTTYEIKGNKDDLPGFSVTASTPVLTYAAHYSQDYTIVIPKRTDLEKIINIRVEIINQANTEQRPTITIHADEDLSNYYPGTRLEPVVFKGVTWAPVNVGATEIGSTTELKHTGYYYQWGRNNIGFVWGGDSSDRYHKNGAEDWYTATEGAASKLFISNFGISDVHDWLTPEDGTLWSGEKQQGPCPDGWCVPGKTDLQLIETAYGSGYAGNNKIKWNAAEQRLEITGDNKTDKLYFPAAGFRNNGGASTAHGAAGCYWSSDPDDTSATCLDFYTSSKLEVKKATGRVYGYSVRCVKK